MTPRRALFMEVLLVLAPLGVMLFALVGYWAMAMGGAYLEVGNITP